MSKPAVLIRSYWDACLFLDLVNKTQEDDKERILLDLLEDLTASEPKVVAVTSILTIAEVACAAEERAAHTLSRDVLARIEKFWGHDSPFQLVEVFPSLAVDARDIIRDVCGKGSKINPYDALHFATARKRGVTEFLTFDKDLLKLDGMYGFKVRKPKSDRLAFGAAPKAQGG
jgi:predicted nucleic acid-binding protein